MSWTREAPRERGWYWTRWHRGGKVRVAVVEIAFIRHGYYDRARLASRADGGEWKFLLKKGSAKREWWPTPIAPPSAEDAKR